MMMRIIKSLVCVTLVMISLVPVHAKVLPEEGAELLYHRYQGGGMKIDGPSVLVRKNIGNNVSLSAHHYIDSIIGASIDVEVLASQYTEERKENTIGLDLLRRKTLFGLYATESLENDYDARFYSASLSQDFFGDLTTISLGFSRGFNVIGKTGSPTFEEGNDSRKYTMSVSQIVTKHLIMNFALDGTTDEGFLNNPYRQARLVDSGDSKGYRWIDEVYPSTHTSVAGSIKGVYYLPYRASILSEARLFTDSWGIQGRNFKVAYRHTKDDQWIFEGRLRYYSQDHADFYSDLFNNQKNFMGRDKELSTYTSISFGFTVTYEYEMEKIGFLDGATLVFSFDRLALDYDDFRDARVPDTAGSEPLYSFNANIYRLVYNLHY